MKTPRCPRCASRWHTTCHDPATYLERPVVRGLLVLVILLAFVIGFTLIDIGIAAFTRWAHG